MLDRLDAKIDKPGLYGQTVTDSDAGENPTEQVAVNLDPSESNERVLDPALWKSAEKESSDVIQEEGLTTKRISDGQVVHQIRIWRPLLWAALGLMAAETFLGGMRRQTSKASTDVGDMST